MKASTKKGLITAGEVVLAVLPILIATLGGGKKVLKRTVQHPIGVLTMKASTKKGLKIAGEVVLAVLPILIATLGGGKKS